MKSSCRFSIHWDKMQRSRGERHNLVPACKFFFHHERSLWASDYDANQLFDGISSKDVVSATALISQLSRQSFHEEALNIFSRMLRSDIRPNEYTFGTVFHSATAVENIRMRLQLHSLTIKMGLESNVFVGSSILDSYVKMDKIDKAQRAFEDTNNPNVVSWTSLIRGYLKKNNFEGAMFLFKKMPNKNVVSWNAIMSGCSQTGRNEETVNLFVGMLRAGLVPDESTFCCVVSAVANIAAIGIAKSFHASAVKFLGKLGVFAANSLISCYAKCGSMEDSLLVFDKLREKNIVSWNAVICGCAQNGKSEAVRLFEVMKQSGYKPNSVTLLGLLWACNHSGLVDKGYSYFNEARNQDPSIIKYEHYACMVDLLARSGNIQEAEEFINSLPFNPGIGFWKALLGGCQIHSNTELGEVAAHRILALDPADASSYVMVSNAHSSAGKWKHVSIIRREMKERGLKIIPGCSWIEIRSRLRVFVNGDKNHERQDDVFELLWLFTKHMRDMDNSWPLY